MRRLKRLFSILVMLVVMVPNIAYAREVNWGEIETPSKISTRLSEKILKSQDINNVQRNAWFTPQVLSLSRATTTGFPDVSMTPTVGTPFLISKNGLLLPEHSWLSLYSSICAFPVFRLSTETV